METERLPSVDPEIVLAIGLREGATELWVIDNRHRDAGESGPRLGRPILGDMQQPPRRAAAAHEEVRVTSCHAGGAQSDHREESAEAGSGGGRRRRTGSICSGPGSALP